MITDRLLSHLHICAGALYPDGTTVDEKRDDAVPPGVTLSYEWTLPEDHSPTSEESNCLTRFYHSHVSAPKDINSGLIGPLLICKRGTQTPEIQAETPTRAGTTVPQVGTSFSRRRFINLTTNCCK